MTRRKQLNTRLDHDYYDKLEAYAEDRGCTNAEAGRRAVRHFIDEVVEDEEDENSFLAKFVYHQEGGYSERVAGGMMAVSLMAIAATTLFGPVAATLVGIGALGAGTYAATVVAIGAIRKELASDGDGDGDGDTDAATA
jgi:predicted DNA-binding protein